MLPTGDGVEQLKWRLENGELPHVVPPKVIVLAIGSNAKGMVRILSKSQSQKTSQVLDCSLVKTLFWLQRYIKHVMANL